MSWHFSQAVEAAYLEENSLDGKRFAPWKSTPSAPDDSCSAKMKDTFHRSPYGTMFVPSTDVLGADVLKWFQGASRAKTLARLERELVSRGSEAASGENLQESLAKWNPDTYSWKNRQGSLFEDSGVSLETFPAWGMMRGGELWELPIPSGLMATRARITNALESGYAKCGGSKRSGKLQGGTVGTGRKALQQKNGQTGSNDAGGCCHVSPICNADRPRCERKDTPQPAGRINNPEPLGTSEISTVSNSGEQQRDGRMRRVSWWEREPEEIIQDFRGGGRKETWLSVYQSELGRVADVVADRVDRLTAIGNGQVPAVAKLAWEILCPSMKKNQSSPLPIHLQSKE